MTSANCNRNNLVCPLHSQGKTTAFGWLWAAAACTSLNRFPLVPWEPSAGLLIGVDRVGQVAIQLW